MNKSRSIVKKTNLCNNMDRICNRPKLVLDYLAPQIQVQIAPAVQLISILNFTIFWLTFLNMLKNNIQK